MHFYVKSISFQLCACVQHGNQQVLVHTKTYFFRKATKYYAHQHECFHSKSAITKVKFVPDIHVSPPLQINWIAENLYPQPSL